MPNRTTLQLAVIGLVLTAFAGCSSTTASTSGSGNIATVNGQPILRDDYVAKLEESPQAKSVLNQMVQGMLIDQYAKDNNITIADGDVAKKEDEIRSRYPPGQFEQILKQQNLTEDDVKKILREQLVLQKAVGKDVHVSDADVKAYIEKNHAALDKPAQVDARHILVADLKTAQDVESKLKAGAKFEDLAKEYSTDPSSKDKGGDLGFFGRGQMVPPFEAAAFSQKIGVVGPGEIALRLSHHRSAGQEAGNPSHLRQLRNDGAGPDDAAARANPHPCLPADAALQGHDPDHGRRVARRDSAGSARSRRERRRTRDQPAGHGTVNESA
jgi:parvulin-like peptidyl-prolyl isomerase